MSDNIDFLPIWKKGSTACEFFMEIAHIARKHPERFVRMALIYEEELSNEATKVRYASYNLITRELIGLIEIGKDKILTDNNR